MADKAALRKKLALAISAPLVLFLALETCSRIREGLKGGGEDRTTTREGDAPPDPLEPFGDKLWRVNKETGDPEPSLLIRRGDSYVFRRHYLTGPTCWPFFICGKIAARKPPREIRISCLGGSVAGGPSTVDERPPKRRAFCERVREALAKEYPDRSIKAYNFGVGTLGSPQVVPMLNELARKLSFDIIILYMGHNEFINALVDKELLIHSCEETGQRIANFALRESALMRSLVKLTRKKPEHKGAQREFSKSPFLETPVFDKNYRKIVVGYETALRKVVRIANRHGSLLAISELVANHDEYTMQRDNNLFVFKRGTSAKDIEELIGLFERAVAREERGDCDGAINLCKQILARDSRASTAAMLIGRCHASGGDRKSAIHWFEKARGVARYPITVTPEMTEIIRKVAGVGGAVLVPQVERFDMLYVEEVQRYRKLFADDVHLTDLGYDVLAKQMIDSLLQVHKTNRRGFRNRGGVPGKGDQSR